jgi:hypothetical protein
LQQIGSCTSTRTQGLSGKCTTIELTQALLLSPDNIIIILNLDAYMFVIVGDFTIAVKPASQAILI